MTHHDHPVSLNGPNYSRHNTHTRDRERVCWCVWGEKDRKKRAKLLSQVANGRVDLFVREKVYYSLLDHDRHRRASIFIKFKNI